MGFLTQITRNLNELRHLNDAFIIFFLFKTIIRPGDEREPKTFKWYHREVSAFSTNLLLGLYTIIRGVDSVSILQLK